MVSSPTWPLLALAVALPVWAAEDTIKLGVTEPLSGTFKDIGERYLDGVVYAAKVINESGGLLGKKVEVLFEDKVKNRWRGRTPTNKLVFTETEQDLRGKVVPVTVTWTGPWSMQARI